MQQHDASGLCAKRAMRQVCIGSGWRRTEKIKKQQDVKDLMLAIVDVGWQAMLHGADEPRQVYRVGEGYPVNVGKH
jgi:hypothetical protein